MENNVNYDVDYFIRKFEAIPEDMWLIRSLGHYGGPRCALGHCIGQESPFSFKKDSESVSLTIVFQDERIRYLLKNNRSIASINNGEHPNYQQSTPKQRILAALYDIKAKLEENNKIKVNLQKEIPEELTEVKIVDYLDKKEEEVLIK